MRYFLKIFILLLLVLSFWVSVSDVYAAEGKFITIVNPVRGGDFWEFDTRPAANVEKSWNLIKNRGLSATWLLRPDALEDSELVSLLKTLPVTQEIGLLMEVTPIWAKQAGVTYHQNKNWHDAGSVFLTGYSPDERQKLIDGAFNLFQETFGFYPKSVGAWWIDSGSLLYMKEKYGISANMDVADQFTTDRYQVWGQYFSQPFYPSKRNALLPASGESQKIGVVTIQWATRDPFNSYGNGVLDSTYSVQANDYANKKYHSLNTDYFKKLLSIYLDNPYSNLGQVTIGLENDFSWEDYGGEFEKQLNVVLERKRTGVAVLTMSDFSQKYSSFYSKTEPLIIFADDPLGSLGKVLWYQNSKYRVGWFSNLDGSIIRDLRLYQSLDEPCLEKACSSLNLGMSENKNLDEVTYGDRWILDEGKINYIVLKKLINGVEISYVNQSGNIRNITFLPDDIKVNNLSLPVPVAIAQAIDASKNVKKIEGNYKYVLEDGLSNVLISQLKNLSVFLAFTFFYFYLTGLSLLKKTFLSKEAKFILAWPIGMAAFTLAAFVLGTFHFYWGLLMLPILSLIYLKKDIFEARPEKLSLWTIFLILIGSLTWLLTTIKNGLEYDFGLGFWGAHGHDAIWHLSLIESVKQGLPLENPSFAGVNLLNYHYFYDLLLGTTSFLTKISPSDLYFRDFAFLISISLGFVAYLLAKSWFKSTVAINLSLFFLYFGGSFGWIVSFLKDRSLGGESLFWGQQSISYLINPPFAISVLLFLAGLNLFHKISGQKDQSINLMIPLTILWGSLVEFKAYGGFLVLGALFITTIYESLRKNWTFLKLSIPVAILSLVTFLPNNLAGVSLLVFQPFWLVHSMVDSVDRLNWVRLSNARILGLDSGNYFKFITAEVIGLLAFVFGNLGTRFFGIFAVLRAKNMDGTKIFLLSFILLSITIPLLFVQKGAAFNIVQFFYYFLVVLGFLAAGTLASVVRISKPAWFLVAAAVLVTLPTTWDSLHHYIPARPPAMIPKGEVAGLEFLKAQPMGKVLSYYFDARNHQKYGAPQPLFAYQSSSYVSAFSEKLEFIADTVNLEITGVEYKGRYQIQKDIFAMREPEMIKKELKENNIKYIYAPGPANFNPNQALFGINLIFENGDVRIFEVL